MIRVLLLLAIGALTAVAAAASPDRTWPAELRAAERWELAFDVGGVLLEPLAAVGESIGQGQVVARLDPEPFDARLARAQQAMTAAQARWVQVTESIDPEQLRVYSPSITTSLDLGPMRIAVLEAEMGIGTAATELRYARWARAATQLVNPRPGRVTRWLALPGSVVAANQPMVQLEDDSTAEVIARIPSSVAAGLRRGRRAEILVTGGMGHYQATVQSVAARGARDTEIVLRIIEKARPPRGAVLGCRLLPG